MIAVFGIAMLLLGCGLLLYGLHERRRANTRAARLRSRDALEGAGLKLEPDLYCDFAFSLLAGLGVSAMPVTVGKRFLGFFTYTDILRCKGDPSCTYVAAVMTPARAADYVPVDADLEAARKQLARSRFSALPVVDRKSLLLGFISEDSISRALH